ncbi:uncharacterized protein LTR77_000569 [Saxophila tyrrhenica]|uniref:Uncharacterized protein n=1 Tax=Saxophila tyrrhenica TaxID=1690608 RepID=A0AAV9PSY0_9PEZI|nr:hypothetical protein LTR77_000569 [Saxophila tyrrhenica]
MSLLTDEFVAALTHKGAELPGFRWYLSAIVCLGALNYPEEIPHVYEQLLSQHLPETDHSKASQALREALTKASGIVGACRTGNAIRALATATPKHLKDTRFHRANDTDAITVERGRALHQKIYGGNPLFDPSKTVDASPDYTYVVRELFYGKIFSFPDILEYRETGQTIVAALIGMDCQVQVRNQMIGMLMNGVDRREVEANREICLAIALELGVRFKTAPIDVPSVPS